MMKYVALSVVLFCAACGQAQNTRSAMPILPAAETDTCGALSHQDLIGQPVAALETRLILKPVRILRHNTAVTMEFMADRINFGVDTKDQIIRVSCG